MLNCLTSKQLAEWEAFYRIEPFSELKNDYRFAYISSLITNLFIKVHGKKNAKLSTPIDFLIKWDGTPDDGKQQQSVEDMKRVMMGIASSQNKNIKTAKKNELRNVNANTNSKYLRTNSGN